MIDLHTHSTASDGTFSPKDLVDGASKAGLTALALTDHDTVAGIAEAARAAEGLPLCFVPGVELSAEIDRGALHIVGLFVDKDHPGLLETLGAAVESRRQRNLKVVEKLNEIGKPVTMAELDAEAGGGVVGRPHFATVLVRKGYVKSFRVAMREYLGKGRIAYYPKQRLGRKLSVEIIRAAGGVPVLAHPDQTFLLGDQLEDLVRELVGYGLAGIETHCSGYPDDKTRQYARLAKTYGLLESGGSDFHGAIKPGLSLGRGPGGLRVPDHFLQPLKERAEQIRRG